MEEPKTKEAESLMYLLGITIRALDKMSDNK
jgi:hypothetical protein